jgi:hypothetical protein
MSEPEWEPSWQGISDNKERCHVSMTPNGLCDNKEPHNVSMFSCKMCPLITFFYVDRIVETISWMKELFM